MLKYKYTNSNSTNYIFFNFFVKFKYSKYLYINCPQVRAYDNDIPVGSASFKKYDDENAEVKRVFVKEEYRGQGISNELMKMLEQRAREKGFKYFILESGEPLVSAMALYRKIGYKVIPNYGQYVDMEESICMKKKL